MPRLRSDTGKGLAVLDLPRTALLEADILYGDEADVSWAFNSCLACPCSHQQRLEVSLERPTTYTHPLQAMWSLCPRLDVVST